MKYSFYVEYLSRQETTVEPINPEDREEVMHLNAEFYKTIIKGEISNERAED